MLMDNGNVLTLKSEAKKPTLSDGKLKPEPSHMQITTSSEKRFFDFLMLGNKEVS